ncbi:hypothetical protein ACTHTQ_11430, partial [Neisseria sp. P0020.S003]|uniref:hypothetical protein n=1 Tax=Neisseria sp. P0020.S003 TaxID=3436808 RepID=UPI003F7E351F
YANPLFSSNLKTLNHPPQHPPPPTATTTNPNTNPEHNLTTYTSKTISQKIAPATQATTTPQTNTNNTTAAGKDPNTAKTNTPNPNTHNKNSNPKTPDSHPIPEEAHTARYAAQKQTPHGQQLQTQADNKPSRAATNVDNQHFVAF